MIYTHTFYTNISQVSDFFHSQERLAAFAFSVAPRINQNDPGWEAPPLTGSPGVASSVPLSQPRATWIIWIRDMFNFFMLRHVLFYNIH